jgi:hypothetical protein
MKQEENIAVILESGFVPHAMPIVRSGFDNQAAATLGHCLPNLVEVWSSDQAEPSDFTP